MSKMSGLQPHRLLHQIRTPRHPSHPRARSHPRHLHLPSSSPARGAVYILSALFGYILKAMAIILTVVLQNMQFHMVLQLLPTIQPNFVSSRVLEVAGSNTGGCIVLYIQYCIPVAQA